jgi:hypothetical protein
MLKIDHLLERYPRQLSGGQRQRVAIGRALVRQPGLLCSTSRCPISTPICAPKCASRSARLHEELGTTMIYVTHDQIEAMTLADRIVVLNEGRIEQIGTPQELYRQPANRFVAGFIGSPRMNFAAGDAFGRQEPVAPRRWACARRRSGWCRSGRRRRPARSCVSRIWDDEHLAYIEITPGHHLDGAAYHPSRAHAARRSGSAGPRGALSLRRRRPRRSMTRSTTSNGLQRRQATCRLAFPCRRLQRCCSWPSGR